MTFRAKVLHDLLNSGLWEEQAAAVLQKYIESDLSKEMRERLDEQIDGYAAPVWPAVWLCVRRIALEWIDTNCPNHWAREMFI